MAFVLPYLSLDIPTFSFVLSVALLNLGVVNDFFFVFGRCFHTNISPRIIIHKPFSREHIFVGLNEFPFSLILPAHCHSSSTAIGA